MKKDTHHTKDAQALFSLGEGFRKVLMRSTAMTVASLLVSTPAFAVGQYETPVGTGNSAGVSASGQTFGVLSGATVGTGVSMERTGSHSENMGITQTNSGTTNSGSSYRTVLDWNTFNLGTGASITFNELTNSSVVVNRVTQTNADSSTILGRMTSKVNGTSGLGRVMVLDKNGVIFGAGSTVNVGGIVASTGNLDTAAFLEGSNRFDIYDTDQKSANAKITLAGSMTLAEGGLAAFVAPYIDVKGSASINAKLGKVALAAGQRVTLDLTGDNLISISPGGELQKALIKHSGSIEANGGVVTMSARAAQNAVDNAINMDGVVKADSFQMKNGKIILDAGTHGKVKVTGSVSASRDSKFTSESGSNDKAGDIVIKGKNVEVSEDARVSAKGKTKAKGGSITVEAVDKAEVNGTLDVSGKSTDSGFAGNGGSINVSAETTAIGEDASLRADGQTKGSGGLVRIWGSDSVYFAGMVSAKGGSSSGNGGEVEISGDGRFDLRSDAVVDTSAEHGTMGNLTIDPSTIYLWDGHTPYGSFTPVLNAGFLANALGLTNVAVVASDKIAMLNDIDLSQWYFGHHTHTTEGNLRLEADTVDLTHDLKMGKGDLFVDADTVNLNGRMYSFDGSLLDRTRFGGTASVTNVLSSDANIQQGVDVSGIGATVYVAAAQYNENVDIYKSLRLQGLKGKHDSLPLIVGQKQDGAVVLVTADNVTVDGFAISAHYHEDAPAVHHHHHNECEDDCEDEGDPAPAPIDILSKYGILVQGLVNDFTASNNKVTEATVAGIALNSVDGATVSGNTLDKNATGIVVDPSSNITISGNTISNGTVGIDSHDNYSVHIQNNTIRHMSSDGILLRNEALDIVQGNTVSDAQDDGIDVANSASVSILNNRIYDSGDNGIVAENVSVFVPEQTEDSFEAYQVSSTTNSGLIINNNSIYRTYSGDGIRVLSSDAAQMGGNYITGAAHDGIHVENSDGVAITRNTIEASYFRGERDGEEQSFRRRGLAGAEHDGIYLSNSDDSTVTHNNVLGNGFGKGAGHDGIHAENVSFTDINRNTIGLDYNYSYASYEEQTNASTGNDGIYVANGYNVSINGNNIDSTDNNGIEIARGSSIEARCNDIYKVGGNGILAYGLYGDERPSIVNATIVSSDENDNLVLSDNTIDDADENGISVFDSRGVTISGNTISHAYNGVRVYFSYGVDVLSNRISDIYNDGIQVGYSGYDRLQQEAFIGEEMQTEGLPTANINIIGNTVSAYGDDGVQVANSTDVLIDSNTIDAGIYETESDFMSFDGGGNSATGIRLWDNDERYKGGPIGYVRFPWSAPMSGNGNVTVTNNTVNNNAVGLDATAANNDSIVVAGNTFNNNTIGAWFGSGLIDMTGASNTFNGGDVALRFEPALISYYPPYDTFVHGYSEGGDTSSSYAPLTLVNDTIGSTVFNGQRSYYVELRNGAFFDPGKPTIIDGTDATYDSVDGGLMTASQLAAIEKMLHDYDDDKTLGQIFVGFAAGVNDSLLLFDAQGGGFLAGHPRITVTGLPRTGGGNNGGGQNPADIEPAAGGDDLNNLEPAAGGEGQQTNCWNAVGQAGQGNNPVTLNLDNDADSALDAAACSQQGENI